MSERRRTGLGRGLGALIPTSPTAARPVDVFFPDQTAHRSTTHSDENERSASELRADVDDEHGIAHSHLDHPVAHPGAGTTTNHAGPGADTTPNDERTEQSEPSHRPGATAANAELRAAVDSEEGVATPQAPHPEVTSRRTAPSGSRNDALAGDESDTRSTGLRDVPARFAELPVGSVVPNPNQPRTVFDEDDLAELAASIGEVGVLQPIVVRPVGDHYELVMGERRWRATQAAGLDHVPAIIRETADTDLLRDALLENLHRANLNPLEEAAAYQQLLEDFECTHEQLATRIARSRPQISNTLRLLRLPPAVQRRVAAGVLSAGHARALLGLSDATSMEHLAHRIVAEGLSVRATEEIVALGEDDEPLRPELRRRPRASQGSAVLEDLGRRLSDRWDTRVKIAMGQRKGRISIEFASAEDLDRILESLAPGESAASS
ncbi:ParB/RepB/Spo0J family partition protein [Miniimonas sp. S16]|uniref:ParB/RepB/Spo0J family partition protein n=1 Tax=Miniimonas sp. S16 TaxID=2171623 RepID=UPI000D529136|nr:ParB/RepB/Spo0J family partition protein [Miniimonas sp. S16]